MNIEIRKDSSHVFEYEKLERNLPATILAASIRILASNGREILGTTPMTISGNKASYEADFSLSPLAERISLGRNFLAEMTIDRVVHNRLFDLVKYPFVNEVTEKDLADENRIVSGGVNEARGEADSGDVNFLIDIERIEPEDFWKGGKLIVYPLENASGAEDQITVHQTTGFDSIGKVLSFKPNRSTPITTESYSLRRSHSEGIRLAGEIVQADLWKKNKRSSLILDSTQVSRLIVYKFFERFFGELATGKDSEYAYQFERYKNLYGGEFENFPLLYDQNDDGGIDPDTEISVSQTFLVR